MPEHNIWLDDETEPGSDALNGAFDGILIGDEACGRSLSSATLLSRLDTIRRSGKKVGLITPYLTPDLERSFMQLLHELVHPTTIVVNDVGALRLVRNSIHIPVIGRLLMRQHSDPVIRSFYRSHPRRIVYHGTERAELEYERPSDSLNSLFTGSAVFSEKTAALLRAEDDVMTVMMDMLPHGIPKRIPLHYRAMLHTGSVLVSVLPCQSCEECPEHEVLLGSTRANVPIYRKRNTCYYKLAECGGDMVIKPGDSVSNDALNDNVLTGAPHMLPLPHPLLHAPVLPLSHLPVNLSVLPSYVTSILADSRTQT